MKPIQCISFPRSGHHLLVRCLTQMYDEQFRYCDFYNHCKKTPCRDPETNFQKSHDFDLRLDLPVAQRRLIQYRHPIDAISSWFNLSINEPSLWDRFSVHDTQASWDRFFGAKLEYWKRFVMKWVVDRDSPEQMLVPYHRLMNHPEEVLDKLAKFLWPSVSLGDHKIPWVLEIQDIRPRRSAPQFRYCTQDWIAKTELELKDMLDATGIPMISES